MSCRNASISTSAHPPAAERKAASSSAASVSVFSGTSRRGGAGRGNRLHLDQRAVLSLDQKRFLVVDHLRKEAGEVVGELLKRNASRFFSHRITFLAYFLTLTSRRLCIKYIINQ